jgi:hypothetical protein
MSNEGYSRLEPFTIDERVRLSLFALNFFSPRQYAEVCIVLDKQPTPDRVESFDGGDFLIYLKKTGKLAEPYRYMKRIGELLAQLAKAGLLTDVGPGKNPILGNRYHFIREFTALERRNVLWLAEALGPEFILHAFSHVIVQVTGRDRNSDVRAGTGLIIAPNWLLTCAHVLDRMKIDDRQLFSGLQFGVRQTLSHSEMDVGLIEISPAFVSLEGLAFRQPRIAEEVYTLGYPRIPLSREPALVMHRGEVTNEQITTFSNNTLFLYSAIARPGNSGGPIISSTGNVVGIVTEELREDAEPDSLFYAGVGAAEIAKAVSELDVSVKVPMEDYRSGKQTSDTL